MSASWVVTDRYGATRVSQKGSRPEVEADPAAGSQNPSFDRAVSLTASAHTTARDFKAAVQSAAAPGYAWRRAANIPSIFAEPTVPAQSDTRACFAAPRQTSPQTLSAAEKAERWQAIWFP